jgi:hypothetical protein
MDSQGEYPGKCCILGHFQRFTYERIRALQIRHTWSTRAGSAMRAQGVFLPKRQAKFFLAAKKMPAGIGMESTRS